jgi:hypothetical protein
MVPVGVTKSTCEWVAAAGNGKRKTNLGLVYPISFPKFHYAKRRFSVTSKNRHMYEVLNVDEIKN